MANGKRSKNKKQSKKNTRRVIKAPMYRNPFPPTQTVKLRYCHTITIDPAIAIAGYYLFRANSIGAPSYTSTTHRPMLFDQLAALYDHYHVMSSDIKCNFFSNGATPTVVNGKVGIRINDDNSTTTDPDTLQEQPGGSWKDLSVSNGSNDVTTVSKTFNSKRFFNRGISDSQLSASMYGSPLELAYFQVIYMPLVASQDLAVISVNVTIDYIVNLSERKVVTKSLII